ncbi:hypothetical protein F5Y08DRAFT_218136 [Xylaria arbuscula]|nr:hypothetical protein F5Y08DRAFT_218136 [Xylaria arbuscula]
MNIPGYYYDSEKRRYFKVEQSKTAPANAAWSSDSVKRRKLHDEATAVALRHLSLAKNRIRQARVLHDPLTGGFLAREYGAHEDDMQAACFASGLIHKGCMPLKMGGIGPHANSETARRMLVVGYDYKTGLCNAYAAMSENLFLAAHMARDKNGRLNERSLASYRVPSRQIQVIPSISDIQYHASSRSILLTSRKPPNRGASSLYRCSPMIDDDSGDSLRPLWGSPSDFTPLSIERDRRSGKLYFTDSGSHCVATAPTSSSLGCVVGTNQGIVQWDRNFQCPVSTDLGRHQLGTIFRDVFAIGFHPNHGQIFRFGGRPGILSTADTRVPFTEWSYLKLPSTITNLKCLDGGNQVLVAGLQNRLGVYDMRFARSNQIDIGEGDSIDIDGKARGGGYNNNNNGRNRRHGPRRGDRTTKELWHKPIHRPVINFERYRNSAQIDIGFAYDTATSVVAAAHDDVPGTVALYSVRTGSQLRVLKLPADGSGDTNPQIGRRLGWEPSIIQSLQFETWPGDKTPTLFVGDGPGARVTAFSFGVNELGEEA